MKVASINIRNFKFFINETCEFDSKNVLLYGENGSGKSSLYYALYRKIKNKQNINEYKNRTSLDDIGIDIWLTDNSKFSDHTPHKSYFINHSILTKIINTEDFFHSIINIFFSNFTNVFESMNAKMEKISSNLKDIRESETLRNEIYTTRKSLDDELKNIMQKIQITSNDILKKFEENSNLSFEIIDSRIDISESIDPNFTQPKIDIKIDNISNIKGNFNEATLKVSALAIFFALIEMDSYLLQEDEKSLKLLLFDDILLSIDMGNRIYITKYIFENFNQYQKIVLTHSLSFFDLFKRMKEFYEEKNEDKKNQWREFTLYKSKVSENKFEPKLYLNSDDYLSKAEKALKEQDFEGAGNNLRKELEKTVNEINRFLQIGKEDKLETLLLAIRKQDKYFVDSQKLINEIIQNNKIEIKNDNILDTKSLNAILKDNHFLKDMVMNKASHANSKEDFYQKELDIAVIKIKELINEIKKLKQVLHPKKKESKDKLEKPI